MPLREVETSPKATKSRERGCPRGCSQIIIRTAWNGTSSAACAIAGCCLRVVRTAIGIPFERPTRFVVSEFSKTAPLFCARKASGFIRLLLADIYLFSGGCQHLWRPSLWFYTREHLLCVLYFARSERGGLRSVRHRASFISFILTGCHLGQALLLHFYVGGVF